VQITDFFSRAICFGPGDRSAGDIVGNAESGHGPHFVTGAPNALRSAVPSACGTGSTACGLAMRATMVWRATRDEHVNYVYTIAL